MSEDCMEIFMITRGNGHQLPDHRRKDCSSVPSASQTTATPLSTRLYFRPLLPSHSKLCTASLKLKSSRWKEKCIHYFYGGTSKPARQNSVNGHLINEVSLRKLPELLASPRVESFNYRFVRVPSFPARRQHRSENSTGRKSVAIRIPSIIEAADGLDKMIDKRTVCLN